LIILGIDPGSRTTGYGLIRTQGNKLLHLDSGAIRLHKYEAFSEKLCVLYEQIALLIQAHQPDAISLEQAFFGINVRSALMLGQVRGSVLTLAGLKKIPVFEYSATAVKKAITGYGRAEKPQMQEMVRLLLNLRQIPKPHDAADALALAICHAHSKPPLAAKTS